MSFLGVRIPEFLRVFLNIGLVLLPVGLWIVFSLIPERSVPQPRTRLVSVLIVSALTANAVGYPFINEFLQVDQWLSLASAIQRIIGYTLTVGMTQEILKYIVLRSLIWSGHLRTRLDAVAYGAAAALGYATVLNLHFALTGNPPPDAVAVRVFSTLVIHIVATTIIAYGLAESRDGETSPLVMPISLGIAALISGIAIPIRAGLVNASISPAALEFALPRPLFGIVFSLMLLVGGLMLVFFFFTTAERQEREKRTEQE